MKSDEFPYGPSRRSQQKRNRSGSTPAERYVGRHEGKKLLQPKIMANTKPASAGKIRTGRRFPPQIFRNENIKNVRSFPNMADHHGNIEDIVDGGNKALNTRNVKTGNQDRQCFLCGNNEFQRIDCRC